jgi:hypothetical protein
MVDATVAVTCTTDPLRVSENRMALRHLNQATADAPVANQAPALVASVMSAS